MLSSSASLFLRCFFLSDLSERPPPLALPSAWSRVTGTCTTWILRPRTRFSALGRPSHPEDPLGFVSDAAAYLFSEFDRLHVLQSELFTNDKRFEERSKLPPDPAVKAAFNGSLAKADQLVAQVLAHSPQDRNAMFSQILANGLRGDYAALIEKRNLASLGYMKNSRRIAEQLVAIEPTCYDAYLAVGVENYLLSQNPAPVRWILRLSGAQTDKTEGINHLRMTAEKGRYLGPFARLLLAVAALRGKDHSNRSCTAGRLGTRVPAEPSVLRGTGKDFAMTAERHV